MASRVDLVDLAVAVSSDPRRSPPDSKRCASHSKGIGMKPVSSVIALILLGGALPIAGCAPIHLGDASSLLSSTPEKPVESRLAFARLCERKNEDQKARDIYEAILVNDLHNREALHRLAVLATREGKYAEAQSAFDRAVAAGPVTPELANDLGYFHFLQDQLPQAEAQLRKAVALRPDFRVTWTNLGLVLGQQERFDESLAAFLKGSESPAEAHCNQAFMYAQQFKLEQAQSEYRHALALDSTLKVAAEGLLQVSAMLPGKEPVTVVSTVRSRSISSQAESEDVQPDSRELTSPGSPELLSGTLFEPAAGLNSDSVFRAGNRKNP